MSAAPQVRSDHLPAPERTGLQHQYFSIVSGVVLALTVWGFSDNLIWNVGQPSNSDPKFIVHGLLCLAWVVLLFTQATLVRQGHLATHRRLGQAGVVIGAGVILSTLYVFVAVWKGWDAMAISVKANRLLLPGFAVLWALALIHRRRADWHKRCMLMATFYMMGPVLSRALNPIDPLLASFPDAVVDAWWLRFVVTTWSGLFVSLIAYDWFTLRRVHPVTLGGTAAFVLIWIVVSVV